MKKIIFTIALSGLLFTSCSNDESVTNESFKKNGIEVGEPESTPEQIKEAKSETEAEVRELVVNNQSAGRNVKFCKHDPFTNSSGSGYAEVTLKDGSVHYTYFTWFHDSLGKTIVSSTYQGIYPDKNSGC